MTDFPIIFIATAWGPRHGGINAFNADLCRALAKRLGATRPVVCVVAATPTDGEKDNAQAGGVRLLGTGGGTLDSGDVVSAVRDAGIRDVGWWVGHDVTTGPVALSARRAMGVGQVALIHHMAYGQYAGTKHGRGATGISRHDSQRALFAQADRCFAVGPKLRNSINDMLIDVGRPESVMLIPGLAEGIREREPARVTFRAMVFGRMDAEDDRIKQGSLAVAGMADACKRAAQQAGGPPSLKNSRPDIQVVGIEQPGSQTERDLVALAEEFADGARLQVTARPFLEDRETLFRDLSSAHVVLMPSWHEGFGLTGWEAIAAGVPLILSIDSGVHQLLREKLPGAGPGSVTGIEVTGHTPTGPDDANPNPFCAKDVEQVRDAILSIAADPAASRTRARTLRAQLLEKGMTWDGTAKEFLDGLGLNDAPPGGGTGPSPEGGPATPAPEPAARAGWITDPRQTLPPERLMLDSLLLRPEYRIVPFQDILAPVAADVVDWAQGWGAYEKDRGRLAVALRLYTADGGSGKTRLMVEVCGRLLDQAGAGWTAAFVPDTRQTPTALADIAALVKTTARVFLVVDNAESRRRELETIIKAALDAPAGHRVRLVLLGRGNGEWWQRLCEDTADPVTRAFLRSLDAVEGPWPLPRPDTGDVATRQRLYGEAQRAFRDRLHPHRLLPDTPAAMPDLSAPHFRHTLFLHLAALAALLGRSLGTETSLLSTASDWERDYWRTSLDGSGLGQTLLPALRQSVALLTLTGGASRAEEARALLRQVPALRTADDGMRERVFAHLRTLYPRDGGIDALRPDLLGECLIAEEVGREDELLDCVFAANAPDAWITPALTVLTRIGQRQTPCLLRRALSSGRLSTPLVDRAMEGAVNLGDPLGPELAHAVAQADEKRQRKIARHVWPKLPEHSDALMPFVKAITDVMARDLKTDGWRSPQDFCNFIGMSSNISGRYYKACDFDAAERWAKRAFKKFSQAPIKARNAANQALPYLCSAYSNALDKQGKSQEALTLAQQAEEIWRGWAKQRPDAHRADWATSLSNLGNRLADAGRYDEALKASQQAEEIRRELAAQRPDAHRADWATSLSNLGTHLADAGRYDEALKAAQRAEEILRELAAQRPDAHRADWATSLSNLGNRLSNLGQYDEALKASQQAEEILRELAAQRPDAHRADWATTLGNQAILMLLADHPSEAELLARHAEELFAAVSPAQTHRYAPELGWCRALRGAALLTMGAVEQAASLAADALPLFDAAGGARPRDIEPYRALALAVWAREPALPRDEAWHRAQEGLRWLTPHAQRLGVEVLLPLTYVAAALRATAPPGAPDPVPMELDAILRAARRDVIPA